MAITKLTIDRFTAFEHAEFDLSPGVNVLIGENGTGKSHVLKLAYVLWESARAVLGDVSWKRDNHFWLRTHLDGVFRPEEIAHLYRRRESASQPSPPASVTSEWGPASVTFTLSVGGRMTSSVNAMPSTVSPTKDRPAVFLPSREFLTVFPGFIPAFDKRELSFDSTYYDLCKQLSELRLRRPLDPQVQAILDPLEAALGGEVILKGQTFYLRVKGGNDMEATLLAEGIRKIAMLAWLVGNGSLSKGSLLVWDEPEAGVNPTMAPLLAQTAFALADQGVQIVMATHDYVLSSELSLEAERRLRKKDDRSPAAFFGISREDGTGTRSIERGTSLNGIVANPILDAMANLHGREIAFDNSET